MLRKIKKNAKQIEGAKNLIATKKIIINYLTKKYCTLFQTKYI